MSYTDSIQSQVFVDHYQILGLDPSVDGDLVKKAFRRLAKTHHPDYAGGDGLRFLEIYSAYKVLADPERRIAYDRQYRAYQQSRRPAATTQGGRRVVVRQGPPRREIPATRLKFPGTMASLAKRGLLRRKFRSRDRRFFMNIDYDLELLLSTKELQIDRVVEEDRVSERIKMKNCWPRRYVPCVKLPPEEGQPITESVTLSCEEATSDDGPFFVPGREIRRRDR